jgi:transcriptional regulator with XRE-family HTH domain
LDGYLSGKTIPSLNQAEKIATALGVSIEDMLADKPGEKRVLKPVTPPNPKPLTPTTARQAIRILVKFVRENS